MSMASKFEFPINGSESEKKEFCKNEIKDYQLLSFHYFKIEVFESTELENQTPVYVFEDFGVEKGKRTHIVE